jgi:hypothetical protein
LGGGYKVEEKITSGVMRTKKVEYYCFKEVLIVGKIGEERVLCEPVRWNRLRK